MAKLFINANRDGYSPDQCGKTMTVGELINYLMEFDEDAEIFLKHDNGYTFGSITENDFEEDNDDNDDEEE